MSLGRLAFGSVRRGPALQSVTRIAVAASSSHLLERRWYSSTIGTATEISSSPLTSFVTFPAYTLAQPPRAQIDVQPGQRIVVVGDVHGDLNALKQFLTIAQVYDPSTNSWIGGDTICIQCGDIMDRGSQELACWQLLCQLSHQADAVGGALSVLWGNHEVMNALGLFHYTEGDEFERMVGKPFDLIAPMRSQWRRQFAGNDPPRWAACEPGGLLAKSLFSQLSVAVVVGRTLCVHAGLTTQHLEAYEGSLERLNQAAQVWITTSHHGYNYNTLDSKVSPDEVINLANSRARVASRALPGCLGGKGSESTSPVWMRDYSNTTITPSAQTMLDQILGELATSRIVMGHTPQPMINCAGGGKAWRIDIAASRGMGGGTPEVLEIIHGSDTDEIHVLNHSGRIPANERMMD
eukprot:scaffold34646_cov173-Amphora_coffeaeformis.AAC.33